MHKITCPVSNNLYATCNCNESNQVEIDQLRIQLKATQDELEAVKVENERLENQVMARDAELWGCTQEILNLKEQLQSATDKGFNEGIEVAAESGLYWGINCKSAILTLKRKEVTEQTCPKCSGRGWYICGASDSKRKCPECY